MKINEFQQISMKIDAFSAEGGTKRTQFELAITHCFEVDFQKLGHFWKAESQGFPTATIRASEDINISSYGHFEIVPSPAGHGATSGGRGRTDGRTEGRTDTADFVHRLIKCYRIRSPTWFPFQSRSPIKGALQ